MQHTCSYTTYTIQDRTKWSGLLGPVNRSGHYCGHGKEGRREGERVLVRERERGNEREREREQLCKKKQVLIKL